MELDDLKKTWTSVASHIPPISHAEYGTELLSRKSDVKAKLMRRVMFSASCTFLGFAGMATSRLWAPVKLSIPLLATICAILLLGFLAELYVVGSIRRLNIIDDSPARVLKSVIGIKKLYRRLELWFSICIVAGVGWMTQTPQFINTDRRWITWIIIALAFALEYVWYGRMMRYLDELGDFDDFDTNLSY